MSQSLFAGWRPDTAGLRQLQDLVTAFPAPGSDTAPALQLRRPDQWHVTLCFAGHHVGHLITPELLGALAEAAATIPAHHFRIERLAYWPSSGAVVALPSRCRELLALCDATQSAFRRCGIHPVQATLQPHVTLAFLDPQQPPQAWLEAIDCHGAPFVVSNFELLFNLGGRYQALGCWPLTGETLSPEPLQST